MRIPQRPREDDVEKTSGGYGEIFGGWNGGDRLKCVAEQESYHISTGHLGTHRVRLSRLDEIRKVPGHQLVTMLDRCFIRTVVIRPSTVSAVQRTYRA